MGPRIAPEKLRMRDLGIQMLSGLPDEQSVSWEIAHCICAREILRGGVNGSIFGEGGEHQESTIRKGILGRRKGLSRARSKLNS